MTEKKCKVRHFVIAFEIAFARMAIDAIIRPLNLNLCTGHEGLNLNNLCTR